MLGLNSGICSYQVFLPRAHPSSLPLFAAVPVQYRHERGVTTGRRAERVIEACGTGQGVLLGGLLGAVLAQMANDVARVQRPGEQEPLANVAVEELGSSAVNSYLERETRVELATLCLGSTACPEVTQVEGCWLPLGRCQDFAAVRITIR